MLDAVLALPETNRVLRLDVPAGAVSVTLGAVLLLWQALGRTVFAGPAGARPAVVTS